jgi:tight adherence protein B
MLPLGLCVLPAFVLLGVAPLMISVVTGTLGGAR